MFEDLSTDFTEEELEEALVDEWGVKYSKDGRKLLKVPEELDGTYSVKKGTKIICDSAFCCCGFLSSVVIPDSVTSIGYNAFYDCRSLSNIIFPNSVTNIGGGAFWLCCLLTSIVIPNSVVSIEEYTFMDCCSLLNIVIPDSVTSIGGCAFSGCSSLTSIIIPNSVVSIAESVTSLGDHAFYECDNLPYNLKQELISRFGYELFLSPYQLPF